MLERDFWVALEYRICREMSGLRETWQQSYWCDGLLPEDYHLERRFPRIDGTAWFGASGQEQWTFHLLLPKRCRVRDQIDWASLLPPENMTRWLAIDRNQSHIEIEPAAAVPDLSPPPA